MQHLSQTMFLPIRTGIGPSWIDLPELHWVALSYIELHWVGFTYTDKVEMILSDYSDTVTMGWLSWYIWLTQCHIDKMTALRYNIGGRGPWQSGWKTGSFGEFAAIGLTSTAANRSIFLFYTLAGCFSSSGFQEVISETIAIKMWAFWSQTHC